MRKKMKSIALSIMMMLPFFAWGELVSLGEIAEDKMVVTHHEGMDFNLGRTLMFNFEPRSNFAWAQPIISKIAIPENGLPKSSDKSIIVLKKIADINDKFGFITSTQAILDKNLNLKVNGKKIKPKQMTVSNGMLIYEFDGPYVIERIGEFLHAPGEDERLLKGIYVEPAPESFMLALEEVKKEYETMKEEEAKQAAARKMEEAKQAAARKMEEEIKKYKEELAKVYTSPKKMGWTPEETETLSDGTVVEHYAEGIRFIKKPNGDYASFIQPGDTRDQKTLNLIKGSTKPIDENAEPIGEFQFTFADGVVNNSNGILESYKLRQGENSELRMTEGTVLKLKSKSSEVPNHFKNNEIDAYTPFLTAIKYKNFMKPDDTKFKIRSRYGAKKDCTNSAVFTYDDGNGKKALIENIWGWKNGKLIVDMCILDDYIYDIDKDGLKSVGLAFENSSFPTSGIVKKKEKVEEGKWKIEFNNGDYCYYYENGRLGDQRSTLPNGTIFERIDGKQKYTFPDGSFFVDDSPGHNDLANLFRGQEIDMYRGYFTDAKGNTTEKDKQKEEYLQQQSEINKEVQALKKKYGKEMVERAALGVLTVGMPVELLRKYHNVYWDSGNADSSWYRCNGRYFKVNNKTGKITYIGSKR